MNIKALNEALNEYTDDMIASENVQKLSEALRLMQKEIKRLKQELKTANQFKELYLSKWEKWEERARSLYREVHGKDAPPQ